MQTSAIAARLMAAFTRHGLLTEATVHWPAGDLPLQVGFTTPTEQAFAHRANLDAPAIEYLTADAPNLDSDLALTINGVRYEVSSAPSRAKDGGFSTVSLRVAP